MELILPLILLFAGPFTGILLNYKLKIKTHRFIGYSVLFSGSFLLGIALFGLMPELFSNIKEAGVWLALGFFMQIILEKFTGGVGHGHIHSHDIPKNIMVLYVGLYLHAFFEGYSSGLSNYLTPQLLSGMIIGIAIHEIPASFSLSVLLNQKISAVSLKTILLLIYTLASPLGYFVGVFVHTKSLISESFSQIITAIIAGTFLHISTTIVFENSIWKKEGLNKWIFIFLGIIISYFACSIG